MFELLLARGADATAALPGALWNGGERFADLGEIALRRGARIDLARSADRPLLNDLVRWGQVRPVLWLLARGADPDVPDQRGWTALHQAASRGNARMVDALLGAGSDPARRDLRHHTPADVARAAGRTRLVARLSRTE
jgi:ankyrin repeat protein